MEATDKDALICDFAETYHILDYEALPLKLRATLASGLREDSRSKTKLYGRDFRFRDEMIMHIYDLLHWIQWSKTEDGARNINRPTSVFDIIHPPEEVDTEYEYLPPDELMEALYGGDKDGDRTS